MRLMRYTDQAGDHAEPVDALYCDGYGFGDRLLEEVPFELTIENGTLRARCLDRYQEGIDWAHWERVCIEFALQDDTFSTTRDLADSDGFIEV